MPTTASSISWRPAKCQASLHNQFSVDEHDGLVRIATTTSNFDPGESWARSSNELFVLADNGGVLEGLGSLQDLAPQETIRSVRFLGDRAFVVTFRDIDPLFCAGSVRSRRIRARWAS